MQKITFTTNIGLNTLDHAKLLLESLRRNLDGKEHQILIFIDADNENVLDYLLSIKDTFADMSIIKNNLSVPIGYQRNNNILTEHAKYDIISYLQSDMVVGPHYDTAILKHCKRGRILSSTRVEPPLHGESPVTITRNFGLHPDEFDFDVWNSFSMSTREDKLVDYFFAPITYYKEDWMKISGYDTVFRRAREDSDFVQRCLHAGIELVQTFSANVYHFTCVSSRGKKWFDVNDSNAQQMVDMQRRADGVELMRFIRKWGSFNHGDNKLFKLDTDLVVKNYTLDSVMRLEPFFSRIWLSTEEDKRQLLSRYESLHAFANSLMRYSEQDWNDYQRLFRLEDFDSILNVGVPDTYSVKITLDVETSLKGNIFLANIQNLHSLLTGYEAGEYQLDGVDISIRDICTLPTPIVAENPEFDYSLLTVY